jgi:2-isopropylmalate synthase
LRQYAEGWSLDQLLQLTEEAIAFAVGENLPVMYVTEDTTRADPDTLRALYSTAIRAGAKRLCIADTVGHATPAGAAALVRFAREVAGPEIGLDWHGHNDRGLALANALAAGAAGATRLHGCAAGIGERVGNTACDQLLVNLKLMGHPVYGPRDMSRLVRFVQLAAQVTGHQLPVNYPVAGADAFRTATGVHAAAIIKAQRKGDRWLADRVYSGVPAEQFGKEQQIEIGPMSGLSNVKHWLARHEIAADEPLAKAVLARAKASNRTLTESEVAQIVREVRS